MTRKSLSWLFVVLIGSTLSAAAQSVVAPPGSQQPKASARPRIAPVAEAQRTDAHRQVIAKLGTHASLDYGLNTLLQLPPLAEAVMPFTIYLINDSSLTVRQR